MTAEVLWLVALAQEVPDEPTPCRWPEPTRRARAEARRRLERLWSDSARDSSRATG